MKHFRILFLIPLLALLCPAAFAQRFDDWFTDRTLRIDYTFSGTSVEQHISLDGLSSMPRWYGKRQRLAEVPVHGYGQVVVRRADSDTVLFRQSFSTLFQEWLTYPEARTQARSFENVVLVPMPKVPVDVEVTLVNSRLEPTATATHRIDPTDVLIRSKGTHPTPYVTLQEPADTANCIHLAYVAEGYRAEEMDSFLLYAREANEAMFAHEPFRSLRDRFQVVALTSASAESGPSIPAEGIWRETALGSSFSTFYIDRYLTTLNMKRLHDVLAGTPYEHIIVLVNTDKYGGGGILNFYNLTSTRHRWFKPVVVHEFGHSFAGLADEYGYENEEIPMYPHDVEPWEPNITTLVDFKSKWDDMISASTPRPTPETGDVLTQTTRVGLFEGAGYNLKGIYRPVENCRMRVNTVPDFCPVCQRALRRVIDFYTAH